MATIPRYPGIIKSSHQANRKNRCRATGAPLFAPTGGRMAQAILSLSLSLSLSLDSPCAH